MRQGFTAALLLLAGLPWKTELQKAAEDKEPEVKLQPQRVSLVWNGSHEVTFSSSGKTSSCKHPQLSHQQGWNQEDMEHSSSGKPVAAGKVQKFLTRAELLPQSGAGTLKTGGHVSKSLSVSFSCIN